MTKKIISIILCVLLVMTTCLGLCSCKNKKSEEFPVTVGGVTLESEPKNIIVLSPELIDIISCIRYDMKIIGRTIECDQEFLATIPTVGSEDEPDTSAIIASKPDLVITSKPLSAPVANSLKKAEIPVATFKLATNFSELEKLYKNLGTLLGGKTAGVNQATKYYKELLASLDRFQESVPKDIIATACYLYLDENGTLCTFTTGSIEEKIFSYCGAKNSLTDQQSPQVDLQVLRLSTPLYIFVDDVQVIHYLKSQDELQNMHAIMYDKIFVVRKTDFNRHGDTMQGIIYDMMVNMFKKEEIPQATVDEATPDEITPVTEEPTILQATEEQPLEY